MMEPPKPLETPSGLVSQPEHPYYHSAFHDGASTYGVMLHKAHVRLGMDEVDSEILDALNNHGQGKSDGS
jgi:hypothetical protein